MNFKTTGLLLLAVLLFGGAYVLFIPKADPSASTVKPPAPAGSVAAQPVIEPKLGDITKIVAKVKGEEWVFEKTGDAAAGSAPAWKMTKPLDVKVQGFDVDRIARQITNLQYEISLEPGTPGAVSAAQAGLEPAETVVTLTDTAGKSATLEIGNAASTDETYVRLPGQTRILAATTALRNMLKPRAIEYRDPQLWNFAANQVQKVEIVDRSASPAPMEYRFVRDGAKWNMEAPAVARATGKVEELLQTISRLRVTKWEDNRAERLAAYGLQPAALSVAVTVEEEIPSEVQSAPPTADGETPEAPKTTTKQSRYELHVSALSPLGEDTKTYVRAGDETAVASIMKTLTEKLRPVMSEWRDMHVSPANPMAATRVDYATPDGAAVLVKKPDGWHFDGAGDEAASRADDASMSALLQQMQDLTATAFVDESMEILAAAGFTKPVADLKLTVPGLDGTERIVIGAFSDPQTKRLRYARRNDSKTIAKVKADDVKLILAGYHALRDRTILSLPSEAIHQMAFTVVNPCWEGHLEYTLARGDQGWTLATPVKREVRADGVEKLLTALQTFSALAVVADAAELSAYGLHEPAVKLTITSGDPALPVTLMAAAHEGKYYATRSDRSVIYEIAEGSYRVLLEELLPLEVLRFDAAKVKRFTIRHGAQSHGFERSGTKWVYIPERDLPLDPKKVENLLLQIHDLKRERVISFTKSDAERVGLTEPEHEITVEFETDPAKKLFISEETCDLSGLPSPFSRTEDSPEVFLLPADSLRGVEIDLSKLE